MKKRIIVLLLLSLLTSCADAQSGKDKEKVEVNTVLGVNDRLRTSKRKVPKNLKTISDCVDSDPVYTGAEILQGIEKIALDMSDVKISDAEINDFGNKALVDLKKKYKFIKRGKKIAALRRMLRELLSVRRNPSKIKYQIHLIDDKMINAFTVGGHIIITTGIIKEANSLSVVASIIGHEIGHNEKGHLNRVIKKIKIAKEYGSEVVGQIGVGLQNILTPAFNQPNEIEADLYGVDLCYAAGYDPSKGILFWKKMSKKEGKGKKGLFESFMRSHPFSTKRAKCLKKYIELNY